MTRFRLEDVKGRQLTIFEAEHKSEADLHGLKTYPSRFWRSVDLGEETKQHEAGLTRLQESYERNFLKEGKSAEEARRMATIAAEGRGTSQESGGSRSLEETFEVYFLQEGYSEEQAKRMAEIATEGRR